MQRCTDDKGVGRLPAGLQLSGTCTAVDRRYLEIDLPQRRHDREAQIMAGGRQEVSTW